MGEPITLSVRGAGGSMFTMDVPDEGTHQHGRFIDQVRSGELVVLDDDGNAIERGAVLVELGADDTPEVDAATDDD